ncbi:unnamed protein product [marine sediment metagenome]|uniref:Uncharacterized protein n=1 Tax=marine sediment metagenome TaxID=412755 RepID=X0SRX6_9ZZZZ
MSEQIDSHLKRQHKHMRFRTDEASKFVDSYPNLLDQLEKGKNKINQREFEQSDNLELLLALQTKDGKYVIASWREDNGFYTITPKIAVHGVRYKRDSFLDFKKILEKGFQGGTNVFKMIFLHKLRGSPWSIWDFISKNRTHREGFRTFSSPNTLLYTPQKLSQNPDLYKDIGWATRSQRKDTFGDRYYLNICKIAELLDSSEYPIDYRYAICVKKAEVSDMSFTVRLHETISVKERERRDNFYQELLKNHEFRII